MKKIRITFGVIGFILNLVATILQFLLLPVLVLYGYIRILLVRDAHTRDEMFGKYNRDMALAKDILGNIAGRYLFNDLLRKKDGYPFGRKFETISSTLGKNQRINKLTVLGKCLCWVLGKIDKEHCKNSIYEGDCLERIDDIFYVKK
ncbi:MAG: hypothetical protein QXE78_01895 [Nitrososphaeria archaeon]